MLPGQPKPRGITDDIRKKRAKGLMNEDLKAANRLSHHNESVKALYDEINDLQPSNRLSHHNESVKALYKEYLGEAGGHRAHELLHTEYVARPKYKK